MAVALRIDGSGDPADLRSLNSWLSGRNELRGRVSRRSRAPEPGTMGSVTDVLVVALGPSGVAAALASVLISWIKQRTGEVTLRATCACGRETTIEAKQVPNPTPEAIADLAATLHHCPRAAE
ncbi:hypothetical protein GCM10023321_75470 [Pseudonocardia eucalypti]|uniref:Uncharacterized protein n=1 Tax=Pseudonocardia eucalypti TaxID=648755 RepID=A0ABP9RAJ1_9PSEU|nr:hypothetical protein [Pseudonocardia eucalypti]